MLNQASFKSSRGLLTSLLAVGGLVVFNCGTAHAGESLWRSLVGGKPDIFLRYRFEYADDARPGLKEGYASTLRTALGYRTGTFHDISLYFQVQDVRIVGSEKWFYDGSERFSNRALIADAESTEIQQYYLRYGGLPKTVVTLGRQEINHRTGGLQRYIGNVAWRQHFQSFDAAHVTTLALPDTVLDYAYVWNVNRIFGENNGLPNASDFRSDSHLLNLQYNGIDGFKLEGYTYLLDFTSPAARRFSTATIGLRAQGDHVFSQGWLMNYVGEFAHQWDYGNNPAPISVNYALAEVGIQYAFGGFIESVGLKYDYERLEGKGGIASFQTPLGTNHAFQGFADRFLVTPGDGIQDHFATLSAKIQGAQLSLTYHRFLSDKDNYPYGSEWDVQLERPLGKHFLVGLKYADYGADHNNFNVLRNSAGGQAIDLSRFWAYLQFNY